MFFKAITLNIIKYMKNSKDQDEKAKKHQIIEEGKNDQSVKDALKKEKQPTFDADLSPLQNTHQVGTSGGDQRDNDIKPNKSGENYNEDPLKNAIGSKAKVPIEESLSEENKNIKDPTIIKNKSDLNKKK